MTDLDLSVMKLFFQSFFAADYSVGAGGCRQSSYFSFSPVDPIRALYWQRSRSMFRQNNMRDCGALARPAAVGAFLVTGFGVCPW